MVLVRIDLHRECGCTIAILEPRYSSYFDFISVTSSICTDEYEIKIDVAQLIRDKEEARRGL